MDYRQLLKTCISFGIVFIFTQIQHVSTKHPHRHKHGRLKRQDGEGSSGGGGEPQYFILDDNSPEYGTWGPWSAPKECSRPCGGGVAWQTRECYDQRPDGRPACRGASKKYFSCNIEECATSVDYRSEQCAAYNDVPYNEVYYKWVPYTKAPNKCQLNCMPRGERFYHRHKDQVVDGTKCDVEGKDVCVEGKCMPVGCDGLLGSPLREDRCRVCGGDGSSCQTLRGVLENNDMQNGYNDLLLIPAGAMNVKVRERTPSNNYLAIRNMSGHYYLNGNWRIDFPRPIWFAGTVFNYERNTFYAREAVTCLGPTTEHLFIVLLYQDQNTGVEYEYSIPNGTVQETGAHGYAWQYDEFSPCSVNCGGGGYKSRRVWCTSSKDSAPVSSDLCDPALEPVSNQMCGAAPCPPEWRLTEWSQCSANCGDNGTQTREVECVQINEGGKTIALPDSRCSEQKPPSTQECNRGAACPKWHVAPWKPCDHLCGEGKQKRTVSCYREDSEGHRTVVPDSACSEAKPEFEKPCNLRPCEGVDWLTSEWSGCEEKCGASIETRTAVCATKEGKIYADSFCLKARAPILERQCENPPPCEHQWYATQWSKCSAKCGTGIKTRKVFCGLLDDESLSIKKVEDSKCDPELKYNTTENCTSNEPCKGHWMAGPWSQCSKTCGGGTMDRKVLCFIENKTVASTECDPEKIMFTSEECNKKPCGDDELIPVSPTDKVAEAGEEEECEEEEEDMESSVNTDVDTDDMSTVNPRSPDLFARQEGSTTPVTITTEEEGSGDYESSPISTGSTTTDVDSTTPTGSTDGSTVPESTVTSVTESEDTTVASESTPVSTTVLSTLESSTDASSTPATEVTETMMSDETPAPDTSLTPDSSTGTSDAASTPTEPPTETPTTDIPTTPTTETPTTPTSETPTTDLPTTVPTQDFSVITIKVPINPTTDVSTIETSTPLETSTLASSTVEASSTVVSSTTVDTTLISSTLESSTPLTSTVSTLDTTTAGSSTSETSTVLSTTEGSTITSTEQSTSSESSTTIDVSTITTAYDTSSLSTIDSTTTLNPLQTAITKEITLKKCKTKKPKKPKCGSTEFGCCFDGITAAKGPFSAGCPEVMTCNETEFKCCPDGVSPAVGPKFKGCPPSLCKEELFGCCPDGVTTADNENGTNCPELTTEKPSCKTSKFGCCPDNILPARGPKFLGCAEDLKNGSTTPTPSVTSKPSSDNKTDCTTSPHGCCPDHSPAPSDTLEGCPGIDLTNCTASAWGCCPGSNKTALSADHSKGCKPVCADSPHGCCDDNVTAAHGPYKEGCCLNTAYGCCPDNILPAQGPHLEGCGCVYTPYGCCPDNQTVARGPDNAGCGCQYTPHKCCPDKYTPASGPSYEGCPCYTYQFGCCPDGVTRALGPRQQGCGCQNSPHGCCGDGQTPAPNPAEGNCTCDVSKWGCCPDGVTEAGGKDFDGCADIPKRPSEACSLPKDNGPCREFTVKWFYDGVDYGGCNRFWYGGCEGNGNRFKSLEECRAVCVEPQGKDVCLLPKSAGPCINSRGTPPEIKWYYDKDRKQCGQFHYGGCPGNNNRFDTRQDCEALCGEKISGNPCDQTAEKGDCNGNYPRWAFDKGSKSCTEFSYGGCKGNGNNFKSESACLEKCLHPGRTRDECLLPRAAGSCAAKVSRWYFDQSQNRCMPFYFTGCDGNGNNFESRQACETMCPPRVAQDICLQPAVIGDCANYVLSWYFDSLESRCKQFYYGGCGGNQNNFMTEESCQARCTGGGTAVVVPTAPPQPAYSGVDVCDQPKDVGPCDGNYEQWYYDRDYDRCLSFQYGGCQGNHNRFNDQWSCQERCVKNIPPPDPALTPSTSLAPPQEVARHDLCFLESNEGPCSQQEAAWYFDRNSYRCQSFIYGGCEGNANRFNTEEQCERQCGEFRAADACNVPVDAGPCKGSFPKFYFDPATRSCIEFGYSGCQGSANRFSSMQECESVCLRQEEILPTGTNLTEAQAAICNLPAAYGSCTENHKRFYYDERRGTCIAFGYSGCGGNLNRFTSATECLQYCAPQTQNEIDPSPSPSPEPEDPCASAVAECRSVFNCQYGVERWLNQHGCERCRCNDPCANDHPGCPSDTRCAIDPVRDPDSRETRYIAVCRPLNKEGECRPTPLNVCADNCHDDAECPGQAKCCPNECGMACSTLIDSTTTTTSTQSPYPLYSPTQYAPDTPSPPQFYNESEPNVEAEEGNFVTLRCIAIGFPVPVYTWSKGEVRIDGSDGHFKLTMDGILQIVGLVRQDAGIYVCMAANGVGNPLRKEFNVVVKNPVERPAAVIGEDSTAVMVRLGRPTIVPCYAIGYPRPAITWWHQNDMIPLHSEHYDVNKNILTIKQVVPERLGEYTCQAYNGLGKAVSWTVHLQSVPDGPDDPNAIDYSGLLSSAFPQTSVLTTASTTTTQATSPFVYEVPVKVNVTLPQTQFGIGADISIPCDVDGHPVPQVFWYKDGGIIENDGIRYRITESNRLHIYHANATDSGEYRCYASNPYSSDSGSVSIQVEGIYIHPHCVDKPLFANCHLIVSGHLCNHKYYGGFCCESCTRAGQLPSRGPHLKRAIEEDSGSSRSKRSLVSRLFDW